MVKRKIKAPPISSSTPAPSARRSPRGDKKATPGTKRKGTPVSKQNQSSTIEGTSKKKRFVTEI